MGPFSAGTHIFSKPNFPDNLGLGAAMKDRATIQFSLPLDDVFSYIQGKVKEGVLALETQVQIFSEFLKQSKSPVSPAASLVSDEGFLLYCHTIEQFSEELENAAYLLLESSNTLKSLKKHGTT
jgi:hypothetical protein